MARPIKRGLSYFPLDTDFLTDRKIQRLAQKYQHAGICTYLTLLCEIYRTEGYYIPYSRELCFDIGFTLQMQETVVEEIISFCLEVRLFDKSLFEQHKVLTSAAIQQRYLYIRKKSGTKVDPAFSAGVSLPETGVISKETGVNDQETPVFDEETTPKEKGNKIKRKESNENEGKNNTTTEKQRMDELNRMFREATTNSPDA